MAEPDMAVGQATISGDHPEEELRRLVPRQFADWRGQYMIEGDPEKRWRDCRVVDISSAGAGLELLDALPEETVGTRIILAVQLKAEVRYINESPRDGFRMGTQFVELTDAESAYLTSLAELGARW